MPASAGRWLALALATTALAGCAQNGLVLQGQVQNLQTQVASLTTQNEQLTARATTLDRDNQELETLLAQSRQQSRILEDQVVAMRDQLGGMSSQVARLRSENADVSKKAEAMSASLQRRTEASIPANNGLQQRLSAISIPGVEVRADGDVVRIELPGDRLFEPGGARLSSTASTTIDMVVAEVAHSYPNQMIGIEGHTNNDPVNAGLGWTSQQQLSIARAMAVHDQLIARGKFASNQLFVAGHGANHPLVSNGTPSGKMRNNRVEIVIYPERAPGR